MQKIQSPNKIWTFEINFWIAFWLPILFTIIAFLISIAYFYFSGSRNEIIFFISLLWGLGTIYAWYYAGETLKKTFEYNRLAKTFEFIQKFDQPHLLAGIMYIDKNFDVRCVTQKDIMTHMESNEELFASLKGILNLCEDISIAIQKWYIDEEVAYLSLAWLYHKYVTVFQPFIDEYRKKNWFNWIYIESQRLANSWKEGKYLSTTKSLPIII